jgi:hypothetical protein
MTEAQQYHFKMKMTKHKKLFMNSFNIILPSDMKQRVSWEPEDMDQNSKVRKVRYCDHHLTLLWVTQVQTS